MFDQLMQRSNSVWLYTTGRFAEERRAFLCHVSEEGYSWHTLRNFNRFLLAIAERVNVRQHKQITCAQIIRAANRWAATSCAPSTSIKMRDAVTKRFIYVAKKWLRFLGKWQDAERSSQFKAELDNFLKELRDIRGFSNETLSTRAGALRPFLGWLESQGLSLKEVTPAAIAAYFVQNKARRWKKSTVKAYGQSLRAFFRFAERQDWCIPRLAETIHGPKIYSMTGLPVGPTWEQVQRLISDINTDRPRNIRDRAIILLLAVYGLRIGEICSLTLDDLDWANEKLLIRRPKNKRVQEFPLTPVVGDAILKYLLKGRPKSSSRFLFLSLRKPHRPMVARSASTCIGLHIRSIGCSLPHYGPHSLRHACATHLLAEGFSLKAIGDHLGHRSTRSVQIYAKVDRAKLGQVATVKLSGLTEYLRTQTQPVTSEWTKERLRLLREVSNFGLGGLQ